MQSLSFSLCFITANSDKFKKILYLTTRVRHTMTHVENMMAIFLLKAYLQCGNENGTEHATQDLREIASECFSPTSSLLSGKLMSHHPYRHSDLEALNGGIRVLSEINRSPCNEISVAREAFTQLASAEDVPPFLRRYYAKVGEKLSGTEISLKKYLKSAKYEGLNLYSRIGSALLLKDLTEEDLSKLHHVNTRLHALEKTLLQMLDGMRERMEGFNPSGVKWDDWDNAEIILWLRFEPDDQRPTYGQDWDESSLMEPLDIRVTIMVPVKRNTEKPPWGLDDGQNHSDLGDCEGSPMQHFHQCYLFHELWDHADVSIWGMLNLRSLWIEVVPHRSGDFSI